MARYDAAGNCVWSVRPGPSLTAQRLTASLNVIALVTSEVFVRASLADGTTLSTDPDLAGHRARIRKSMLRNRRPFARLTAQRAATRTGR
jgi:hypothetical protein